ncbi:MAG TPA: LysM domain-containing protein [Thiotrichales bacterium]|nr:LysM domain-containing protein [Thiotrichales bacterium]
MASPESSAPDPERFNGTHSNRAGSRITRLAGCALAAALALGGCSTPEPHQTQGAVEPQQEVAPVALAVGAPKTYVVQSGDTVWLVASKFLRDPWQWEAVWRPNPDLADPDHLYPGDVVTLSQEDGHPVIQVTGGPRLRQSAPPPPSVQGAPGRLPTVKLEPRVRVEPIAQEAQRVPIGAIIAFLVRPVVLDRQTLTRLPYIVSGEDNRLIYGATDTLYAVGLPADTVPGQEYHLIRPEGALYEAGTGDYLGEKTSHVGVATVTRPGDPATLNFRLSSTEALPGDALVRLEPRPTADYFPHPPRRRITGHVVALTDALSQVGALQIVVLDKGTEDGLDRGAVVALYNASETAVDPRGRSWRRPIRLPAERAGLALVYAALDQVSYALVVHAAVPIKEGFVATNP